VKARLTYQPFGFWEYQAKGCPKDTSQYITTKHVGRVLMANLPHDNIDGHYTYNTVFSLAKYYFQFSNLILTLF
jgi:hypothetical protein